jgi:hypothetical protein
MSVRNTESRFENSCRNIKAELKFVQPHIGDELKASAIFVTADGRSITAGPKADVSLEMLQAAQFPILVLSVADGGFFTFTRWPFDLDKETRLAFGQWRLRISVSSNDENDETKAEYVVQLNPDFSSGWSALPQP